MNGFARGLIWLLTFSTFVFLGSCSLSRQGNDQEKLAMWMDKTTAFCIGRFVLTRPSGFDVLSQGYKYGGKELETSANTTLLEFNHVVAKREQYLRETKKQKYAGRDLVDTDLPWLEDARSPRSDSRLLTFRRREYEKKSAPHDMEGYVYLGDTMFSWTFLADPKKLPLATSSNSDFIQNIRLRDHNDIPSAPGFCFDGGFIESREAKEWAKAYFSRPKTPGNAVFTVEMRPRLKSDDKLLDRVPTLMRMLANLATHTRTLRSGERTVAAMPGEELLIRIKSDGFTAYNFIWEYQGRDDDDDGPISLANPNTRLELRVGGAKTGKNATRETSVLTEQEALALWDALLAGFTLRPGAV
jgi:hypothetical protein